MESSSNLHLISESEAEGPKEDALQKRLEEKYERLRHQQLAAQRKKVEKELTEVGDKHNELDPSVELISDDTVMLFNELESHCARQRNGAAAELVAKIRKSVNKELREALSYLETGYTSAFQSLMKEAEYRRRQAQTQQVQAAATLATAQSAGKLSEEAASQMPDTWKTQMKAHVSEEMQHHKQSTRRQISGQKVTLAEGLSETVSLFAESLATLLFCEVVRIYLYDDNHNLHCSATYPYRATQGDPMRATYTEIMISKELHNTVCGKCIAVNGSEAQYTMLGKRELQLVSDELRESGFDTMRTCLVFPIISHEGANRSYGMIHAVNKVTATSSDHARFSSDDEVMMSICARVLGCILTRYPAKYFTLRVGEAFRKAIYPQDDTRRIDDHLPEKITDPVEDAAQTGNRTLLTSNPMMIYRSAISDVYQTRTQRSRNRKLNTLVLADGTLSSVEFNLTSINQLWESCMEENVVMHRQYRTLSEQANNTRLLLRNLLDGLAATRTMKDAADIARYLQTLELFARSENTEMMAEYIGNTLIGNVATLKAETSRTLESLPTVASRQFSQAFGKAPGEMPVRPDFVEPIFASRRTPSPDLSRSKSGTHNNVSVPPAAATPDVEVPPFLNLSEAEELMRHQKLLNAKVASKLHVDGPECIRAYSCDPASKRQQVQFIEEVAQKRLMQDRREAMLKHQRYHYERPTTCIKEKQVDRDEFLAKVVAADFASRRPFKLK